MTESHPIPALAKTALALTNAEYQRAVDVIGRQTIAALGLNEADDWTVNFDTGLITRDVSDIEPPKGEG